MPPPLEFLVYENQRLVHSAELTGTVQLGRQREGGEPVFVPRAGPDGTRLVIARREENRVGKTHARIEPLEDGRVRLSNGSGVQPIRLSSGNTLAPLMSCELTLPVVLGLGSKVVRIQPLSEPIPVQGLEEATSPPSMNASALPAFPGLTDPQAPLDPPGVLGWLETTLDVLQSAATSTDFFDQAARALVDMVHLDCGRVLLREEGQWKARATHTAPGLASRGQRPLSQYILGRVSSEKRTFREVPRPGSQHPASLAGVEAVVAAPILNRQGDLVGVLYGDRLRGSGSASGGSVSELEARLVELLARGVAAGLARLEQEQAALAARVQFEQFFSAELARHLTEQPDLLQGRDQEVTVLFCDVRGFSRISEKLGAAATMEWMNDVLAQLSRCVRDHDGVLVDYIGDELLAMWGAPQKRADHAERACRAARDMLEVLPRLNEDWSPRLQEPVALGIGIHSGIARVGNVGSPYKFKYGPLGNTVNLASRVQGATKYLHTRALVTGATRARLGPAFALRRLCAVRVVNIAQPVELCELGPADDPGWVERKQAYEQALEAFEHKQFHQAARGLGNLLASCPQDGPCLVLLSRVVQAIKDRPDPLHPVWELPGK
jgi:adenylate cyclase